MKKVLWIGPIVPTNEVANFKAISAAANVWQLGFIDGLIQNNINVTSISYVPYPTWPKGPFWAKKPSNKINKNGLQQFFFEYLNISFLRELWIAIMIVFYTLKKIPKLKDQLVFTYNPYPRHIYSANFLKSILRCKWISIIADNKSYGNPDFYLFLSYDYFKRFNKSNKLFCDGGIKYRSLNYLKVESTSAKSLVFAGALSKWTGIIDFIDLFDEIDSDEYVLHIYGKGDPDILEKKNKLIGNRIILHGFVSDDELDQASKNAYAFINPRPQDLFRSENNFPSKILHYLSYNKPVISTKTKGLSPDYNDILLYYSDQKSFNACIQLINNPEYYANIATKISNFIPINTWDKKVKNILYLLRE